MGLVFSTDPDFCPHCRQIPCACNQLKTTVKKQTEPVRVRFAKNAKGSGVTLIERLPLHPAGKEELLRSLKKALGCGGAVKNGVLELQGDKKAPAEAALQKAGYKVRVL